MTQKHRTQAEPKLGHEENDFLLMPQAFFMMFYN